MPQLKHKKSVEHPKVSEKDGLIPLHQSTMTGGQDGYITIPATPTIATNILGSGNQYYFDLENDTVGRIDDLCLRFQITCSNADVELVPPPYWFSRIVLEAEKGSGSELIHIFPQNMVLWNWLTEDRIEREKSSWLQNYDYVEIKSENAEKYCISERTKFKAGETRDVYLPLPALFMHLNAIDMKHIRSDFRIRMEFSNDVVVSGDVSNISVDNLEAVIRTFSEESFDYQSRMKSLRSNDHKYIYLDHERLTYNDKTLNASQKTRFALDQFVGRCPFLIVVIKPNNNPIASDKSLFNYVEIGRDGTFDITNSSSQSLLGNGTALKQDHIYEIFSNQTNNPHLTGVYLIPFCDNVKKSITGHINGFMSFVGIKDYLEITFDSAPTNEVHTVNLGATSPSGTYRYAFEKGVISDQELNASDGVSTIESAIDGIPQLAERDITVDVNDDLVGTASQTITFSDNAGKVSQDLGKITILGNGISKVNSTSVSTVGKKGWNSGSNYQVEIYMYKFKCLKVDKNGRLQCKDI